MTATTELQYKQQHTRCAHYSFHCTSAKNCKHGKFINSTLTC